MLAYSIIMFAVALLMIILGWFVYKGHTELIHDYHQTRVKDKAAYGKAMGKALMGLALPLIISGVVAFFTASIWLTVILIVGLILAFIPLFRAQKKYNGGLF